MRLRWCWLLIARLWARRCNRLLVLRLLRLSSLLILLHHIKVVDGVLMLLRLYALSARLSIINRLLGGSLLSSCHRIEADAQATAATGAGNHFFLHTLEVVDLQALLALGTGDEFLFLYHGLIVMGLMGLMGLMGCLGFTIS